MEETTVLIHFLCPIVYTVCETEKEHGIDSMLDLVREKTQKALVFKLGGYFSEITKRGVKNVTKVIHETSEQHRDFPNCRPNFIFSLNFFWNKLPISSSICKVIEIMYL